MPDDVDEFTGARTRTHTCVSGWREVTDAYADHLAPNDPAKQAALLNSVYPCKDCQPKAFFRWVQGHYMPDHEPDQCDACRDALGIKTHRRVS